MKNLFLLTILLSLLGVLSVDKTNEAKSLFYEYAPEITVITMLASAFLIKYLWENRIDTHLMIFSNITIIKIIIFFNARSNKKLNKRVTRTQQKLFEIGNVSAEIRGIASDNIALWKEQIKLHERTTALYISKKSSLVQCKNDLRLLTSLLKQVRKEPNAEKKLYQLEASINKFSKNISDKLIEQLDTLKRKDNIIQLTDRIRNFETKAG